MYKVFAVCAFLAAVNAAPADHQATSFASFNDNHNSVHHIQSAPAKYAASVAPAYAAHAASVYAAPAIPVVSKVSAAPVVSSYYSAPAPKYAAAASPVVSSYYSASAPKYAAAASPVVSSYYSASAPKYAASASPVYQANQVITPVAKYAAAPAYAQKEEEYGPAKYEFAYVIEDPHTGDYHSQQEQRDGHHVVGQYSLHEADGTVRLVKYFDEGHGFNAVVERQGHPTEAQAYKKVVAVAAPQYSSHY